MMDGQKREKAPSFSGFVAKAGKWVDEHQRIEEWID
jgi:hypothetical protein